MKEKIFIVVLCCLATCSLGKAHGQSVVDDQIILRDLERFYIEHNTAWSSNLSSKKLIKKLDSLQNIYCSTRYRAKLKRELKLGGLDHDLLTNDLGTDLKHLKTIKVEKDSKKHAEYIVSFVSPVTNAYNRVADQKIRLHVSMVRESGRYKIAAVR